MKLAVEQHLYLLAIVILTAFGQLMIKWRVGMHGDIPSVLAEKVGFIIKVLSDPFVLLGLGAAVFAAMLWIAALTFFELGYAYAMTTAGLIIATVSLASLIFGEPMGANKIIGIMLISFGLLALGRAA